MGILKKIIREEIQKILKESGRDPESIKKQYDSYKKLSIQDLRRIWSRSHRIGDPRELNKDGLIIDILTAEHGSKYVQAAFKKIKKEK